MARLSTTARPKNNALANVTLTANATFGGTTRWDIRPAGVGAATVTGAGFDLTKTDANTVGLATGNELVTGVKNININQGTLAVTDAGTVNNNVAGSIFLNSTGTLSVGNYASLTGVVINKPIVMNGGTLQTDSTGTNGNATLTTGISLTATGNIAAQSGSTLTLNGAIVRHERHQRRLVLRQRDHRPWRGQQLRRPHDDQRSDAPSQLRRQ